MKEPPQVSDSSSMAISVERVALSDLEQLLPLYHSYLLYFGHNHDISLLRPFLAKVLFTDSSYALSAKMNGEMVGFCAGVVSYSPVVLGTALTINDLYVDDSWRRMKVGQALIRGLEKFTVERGANTLFVNTDTDFPWLVNYYEQIGFFAINHRVLVKRLSKLTQ